MVSLVMMSHITSSSSDGGRSLVKLPDRPQSLLPAGSPFFVAAVVLDSLSGPFLLLSYRCFPFFDLRLFFAGLANSTVPGYVNGRSLDSLNVIRELAAEQWWHSWCWMNWDSIIRGSASSVPGIMANIVIKSTSCPGVGKQQVGHNAKILSDEKWTGPRSSRVGKWMVEL